MPSIDYDLNLLHVGLVDLEGYLLSKEIYWPVLASAPAGEPPYPRLTLGSLLLAEKRLSARELADQKQTHFQQLRTRLFNARQKWAVAWEQKAQREFSSRLTLWRNFIEDFREEPDANLDRYDYEVSRRVMIQLLMEQGGTLPAQELELLSGLDAALRAMLVRGDFIWEPELQTAFPQGDYWFLYGRPRAKE